MPVCSFCKKEYKFPRGTTVVQKEGTVRHYCNSKCRKNSEMGRDNRKVKWVKKAVSKEKKSSEKK
jgi:large subunit ribosomal protein L24e